MIWTSVDDAIGDLLLMNRPERLPTFLGWWADGAESLDDDQVRELFTVVWLDAEDAMDSVDEVLRFLDQMKPITDTDEALAGTLIVYRGVSGDGDSAGLSWTLDLDRARWFANRFASVFGSPRVFEGRVETGDVLAFITKRNEREVLVRPDAVRHVSTIDGVEI